MKIIAVILCLMLLLTGCAEEVFETIRDPNDVPVMATPASLLLELPSSAAKQAMEGTSGKLYFCDGYEIAVETLRAGNLDATLRMLTGFSRDELRIVETTRCGVACYESVWSSVGETGDQVGRVMILDDGMFHYCISFMTSAEDAASCAVEWQSVLDSVALAEG
jgi:hypothetical protein